MEHNALISHHIIPYFSVHHLYISMARRLRFLLPFDITSEHNFCHMKTNLCFLCAFVFQVAIQKFKDQDI